MWIRENAEPDVTEGTGPGGDGCPKKSVVESYNNLGLVQVSGYLNMREHSKDAKVIEQLLGGKRLRRFWNDSTEGWYQISSGD